MIYEKFKEVLAIHDSEIHIHTKKGNVNRAETITQKLSDCDYLKNCSEKDINKQHLNQLFFSPQIN